MTYLFHYISPIGRMTMASEGTALIGLWFDGQKFDRAGIKGDTEERELPVFTKTKEWLDLYFAGQIPDFTPELSLFGSDFEKEVLSHLLEIPYGKTMSYGQIARRIAEEHNLPHMSAQAVGGAIGHNRISLIIPCHRVLSIDGGITGYAGGLEKKRYLLDLEHIRYRE